MRRCASIVVLGIALTSSAFAETGVSLTPTKGDANFLPYCPAQMTIQNDSEQVIRAVALRWRGTGPTLLHDVTIPPRTRHVMTVLLPAVEVQQTYQVRLLAGGALESPAIAELRASVSWPPEDVQESDAGFFNAPLCRAWESRLPTWPASLLRNVFLAAVLTCLACGGVAFVGRSRLRTAMILLIAAVSTGATWLIVSGEKVLFEQVVDTWASPGAGSPDASAVSTAPRTTQAAPPARSKSLWVISCRRTVEWTRPDTTLCPVYQDRRQMLEDNLVVRWDKGLTVRLNPEEVRIFRPMRR